MTRELKLITITMYFSNDHAALVENSSTWRPRLGRSPVVSCLSNFIISSGGATPVKSQLIREQHSQELAHVKDLAEPQQELL